MPPSIFLPVFSNIPRLTHSRDKDTIVHDFSFLHNMEWKCSISVVTLPSKNLLSWEPNSNARYIVRGTMESMICTAHCISLECVFETVQLLSFILLPFHPRHCFQTSFILICCIIILHRSRCPPNWYSHFSHVLIPKRSFCWTCLHATVDYL